MNEIAVLGKEEGLSPAAWIWKGKHLCKTEEIVDFNKERELLRSIRPYKNVMIPYSVLYFDTGRLYPALIDRVSVEIVDDDGRRIGIVEGEIQDDYCKQAVPIYSRDLPTADCPTPWEGNEDPFDMAIRLLVDCGRICVRPQDGGYIIGVFNCMKFESCPTKVVQKRPGEWDDFFQEVVISVKDCGDNRRDYSSLPPYLPLPLLTGGQIAPFRDPEYCKFQSTDPQEVFDRARNIIFPIGPVGSYHWTLTGKSNN